MAAYYNGYRVASLPDCEIARERPPWLPFIMAIEGAS
jgi:hypothetical protein